MILAALFLSQSSAWEPERTWVFAVGILEWADPGYGTFLQANRRDAELMDLLRTRGVPDDHILFLRDSEATNERIHRALESHLARAREGDWLLLYYTGHGTKAGDGTTYFVSHDAGDDLGATAWSVPSILDTVEERFRGSHAILVGDCCFSGALGAAARGREGRVSYACLSSSLSSEGSTGNWTFTECVLAGFRGDPRVDLDGDGSVLIEELGRFSVAEMAFVEGQLASIVTTGDLREPIALGPAPARPHARFGERVEVEWGGRWWKAYVMEADGERARIHYLGFDASWDEWVGPDRRHAYAPPEFAVDAAVEVEWEGQWYPAVVLESGGGLHKVHYTGYSASWDEWVAPNRIRAAGR